MSRFRKLMLFLLALIASLVWVGVYSVPNESLEVIACDVGQGDAFLIVNKSIQILIDGGRGVKVLDCLGEHIPFWDRHIELVILTHPQEDHYLGLIDVVKNYDVGVFLTSGLTSGNESYRVLEKEVGERSIQTMPAVRGMQVVLGLIHLDILHPSAEFIAQNTNSYVPVDSGRNSGSVLGSYTSKLDPNSFSVVVRLNYKHFEALFTGDADRELSDRLSVDFVNSDDNLVKYIKIPHHGSKNGISELLIEKIRPDVAVISSGKNNSYGHPHKQVLDLLLKYNVALYRTDEGGDIIVTTDGTDFKVSSLHNLP